MEKQDLKEIKTLLENLEIEYDDMCNYAADVDEYSVDKSSKIWNDNYRFIFKILKKYDN